MQRKKSRFLVFLLSFIPGAGEMYMGFMRMGLSLMLGFLILAAIVGITNLGALAVFPVAMYAYSFFHANNLATMDDRAFHSIPDEYLFGFGGLDHMQLRLEGRNRKIAAVILIVLGVMMLWQVVFNLLCDIFGWDNWFLSSVYYFVRDELPRGVVGIGVIWAGLALIRGKKVSIGEEEDMDRRQPDPRGEEPWMRGQMPYPDGRPTEGQAPYPDNRATEGRMPYPYDRPAERQAPYAGPGNGVMERRMPYPDGRPAQAPYPDNGREQDQAPYPGSRPADDRIPAADGRIIYQGGPVADTQEQPENKA